MDLSRIRMNMESTNCLSNDTYTEEVVGFTALRYIYAASLLCSCLLCIVGNAFNFVVLRKLTNIGDPRKVIFSFLSLSDLCTGIGWIPSIPAVALQSWPFGRGFCVFCCYLVITNLGISIVLIVLVTYDCFVAVVLPYKYTTMITKSRAIAASVFVNVSYYVSMAILMGVGSTGPFSDVQFYPMVGSCFINYQTKGPITYSVYAFSFSLIAFALVIIIMQGMIANISRNHARRIAESEGRFRKIAVVEDFTKTDATTSSGKLQEMKGGKRDPRMPARRHPSQLKGVLVCIAVSAAFFIVWIPWAVWQIYTVQTGACVDTVAIVILSLLAFSQCWINPLIYLVMKRNYRQRLYTILEPVVRRCRENTSIRS